MTPFFIGIAGGSGSGKTALARELKKYFGRKALIFHFDKYQKFKGGLPKLYGMKNWDHSKSIHWDKALKDLISLKKGKITPEIIIVEGYLLFHRASVRNLLNFLIFLEASNETLVRRRTKFKNAKYVQKILLPMHHKYIVPTKKYADLVLNTEKYSIEQCSKKVIKCLKQI